MLLRRILHALRLNRADDELAEEMALHREMARRDHERRGATPAEADLAVRRQFGSALLARDQARDVWLGTALRDFSQDVRFAVRVLAKDRRFTIASVVALALGIAVTHSMFAIVNLALLRELPFDRPERLVDVSLADRNGRPLPLSYTELAEWQRSSSTLASIGGVVNGVMNVGDGGSAPERLQGAYVSANVLRTLRVPPMLGRDFVADDERPGAPPVVILGYDVWQRRYAGSPAVVGRTIRLNAVPTVVVGVMPPRFKYPFIMEVWQPLSAAPAVAQRPDVRSIGSTVGRLRDGVDVRAAGAEFASLVAQRARAHPEAGAEPTVSVRELRERYFTGIKGTLLTFLGAVMFVLLIACANVANLLLARASKRAREMAIRASLGATRWRIVRQMLVECLVLAAIASAIGMALSFSGARHLAIAFEPIQPGVTPGTLTPYYVNLTPDAVVIGFAVLVCLAASLAFGLVPALYVARTDINGVIKDGGPAGELGTRRLSGAFITAELALTVILLTGAGLLWRSFLALYRADTVIATADLVAARLAMPPQKYDTPDKRHAFLAQLGERLGRESSIASFTFINAVPLSPGSPPLNRDVEIAGRTAVPGQPPPTVSYVYASQNLVDALRIPLVRGRGFADGDDRAGQEGAIVDERFAAAFFAEEDPIGRRVRLTAANPPGTATPWLTIVGVVRTVPSFPMRLAAPTVYAPIAAERAIQPFVSIVARTRADLSVVVPALRQHVRALDDDLPLYDVQTLDDAIAQSRFAQRFMGSWWALIAGIALTLAAVGVYGLTANGVAQRTREIGVRMALGARAPEVMGLFLRRTAVHIAIGLTVGLAGALATGQLLRGFLDNTPARDPVTLALVAILLTLVAAIASVVPARRAARMDPVQALRHE